MPNSKAETRDKKVDKIVGGNIKRFRNAKGMSQSQLGDLLKITFQQVQKYEKGINSLAAARIPTFCEALEISLDQLFEGTGVGRLGLKKR